MMLGVGIASSLFLRNHLQSFIVGFVGVFFGWLLLFVVLIFSAQALVIADFFIGLLGLSGLGPLVIIISCLIGGVLGGFGGVLGRSLVEMIDEFLQSSEEMA